MAKDDQTVKMAVKKRVKLTNGKSTVVDGIQELSLDSLERTPLAQYHQMAGNFVNVERYVYEATAIYDKNNPINKSHYVDLFESGYKEALNVPNSGRIIPAPQGEYLTNMSTDGSFDNGTSFLLEQIAVDYFPTVDSANTGAQGITDPTFSASATVSMVNHFRAVTRQFNIEFQRGEDQLITKGKIYEFPSPFVASGNIGNVADGFMQNGLGGTGWNKLTEVHVLKSRETFRFRVQPLIDGFIPQQDIEIRVLLIGKRIRTVYPG